MSTLKVGNITYVTCLSPIIKILSSHSLFSFNIILSACKPVIGFLFYKLSLIMRFISCWFFIPDYQIGIQSQCKLNRRKIKCYFAYHKSWLPYLLSSDNNVFYQMTNVRDHSLSTRGPSRYLYCL